MLWDTIKEIFGMRREIREEYGPDPRPKWWVFVLVTVAIFVAGMIMFGVYAAEVGHPIW